MITNRFKRDYKPGQGFQIGAEITNRCRTTVATNSKRHKSYQKWLHKECFEIGRSAAIYGFRAAERKYHTKEKPLNESSAHRFAKSHKEEISKP